MKRYIPARIVMFPGLGADARMFDQMRQRFGDDLETPDWLPTRSDESFDDYARRWAEAIKPQDGDDRPLFLGGVSFGGMVALRLAPYLKPRAVILLGSCRSGTARPGVWQVAKRVGDCIPQSLLATRWMKALGGLFICCLDDLDEPHRKLMLKMAVDSDPDLIRWSGDACAAWDFDPGSVPHFPPIHQIHGRHDAMIPLHPGDPDTIIADARHILVFSHPHTVNRYVMEVIKRYA